MELIHISFFTFQIKNIQNKCYSATTIQKRTFASISDKGDKKNIPTSSWSKHSVTCYKKLENLVNEYKWEKYRLGNWKGELENRHYGVYPNADVYYGAFFYSRIENKAKAVITYGPYSEGWNE